MGEVTVDQSRAHRSRLVRIERLTAPHGNDALGVGQEKGLDLRQLHRNVTRPGDGSRPAGGQRHGVRLAPRCLSGA